MDKETQRKIAVNFDHPEIRCSYFPEKSVRRHMGFITPLPSPQTDTLDQRRHVIKQLIPLGFLDAGITAKFNGCAGCHKCFPVRINLDEFKLSRSQRRIMKRNQDLNVKIEPLFDESRTYLLSREHFDLMHQNATNRHPGGWFARMGFKDFLNVFSVYDMAAETRDDQGKLMNFTILSTGQDYIYGINFFYDIKESKRRSLGKHTIIALAEACQGIESIKHFYLGSLAQGSPKLDYKGELRGLEAMTTKGWVPYDADQEYSTPDYTEIVPQDIHWPYRTAHKYTQG